MKNDLLAWVDQSVHREFEVTKRLISFEEWIHIVSGQPEQSLRGSAQYMADVMDHFGHAPSLQDPDTKRFKLFDQNINNRKVVGLESVQNSVYNTLRTFQRQGFNNKLILLHGPNGSAKTSFIHSLFSGMEVYSKTADGAMYTYNWVFPLDKVTKGGIGLGGQNNRGESLNSYAKLGEDQVAARIPSELKDHPFLLIPIELRKVFLERLLGKEKADKIWPGLPLVLTQGDLNHRCKEIYQSLLNAYDGDYRKVLMHVQVERIFYSKRYRKGLVTIEPQLHVDAQYNLLSLNRNLSMLPPSLQSLNLFSVSGDLIDGNRGVVEYSDLLKRPVDSFKYLLVACETGSVNVGHSIVHLDAVFVGSCNELQLDAFKEFPDFTSFKARIDLVRVPYLLSVSQEREIYKEELKQVSLTKPVAPHTDWTLALWAVLTRLKKPNSIHYPPGVSSLISNLSPLDKAKLLDQGEMPIQLTAEDRKVLKANLKRIHDEYNNIPYYEGRVGASAREIKSILFSAAQNQDFPNLSPLSVLREMEDFVKRTSEYEFLKQDIKDGYHDCNEFISTVRNEYLNLVDREVRDSMGLYDQAQWEDFIRKYVNHISLFLKKEKYKNPHTGKLEDPDFSLITEFEKIIEAPQAENDLTNFRNNIIAQIGVWSLDHKNEAVVYSKVFPEYWRKLEKHYYQTQKDLLTKMNNALTFYGNTDTDREGEKLAKTTIENMKNRLGYTDDGAREVIAFLMKSRYH